MKKQAKIIMPSIAMLILLICNVLFLRQDIYSGTYYQVDKNLNNRMMFTVKNHIVEYKSVSRDDGSLSKNEIGFCTVTKHDGNVYIDIKSFERGEFGYNPLLGLNRESVFVMRTYSETFVFVSPSAIVTQTVFIIGYITCIYFGFVHDKLRRRKLEKYYLK